MHRNLPNINKRLDRLQRNLASDFLSDIELDNAKTQIKTITKELEKLDVFFTPAAPEVKVIDKKVVLNKALETAETIFALLQVCETGVPRVKPSEAAQPQKEKADNASTLSIVVVDDKKSSAALNVLSLDPLLNVLSFLSYREKLASRRVSTGFNRLVLGSSLSEPAVAFHILNNSLAVVARLSTLPLKLKTSPDHAHPFALEAELGTVTSELNSLMNALPVAEAAPVILTEPVLVPATLTTYGQLHPEFQTFMKKNESKIVKLYADRAEQEVDEKMQAITRADKRFSYSGLAFTVILFLVTAYGISALAENSDSMDMGNAKWPVLVILASIILGCFAGTASKMRESCKGEDGDYTLGIKGFFAGREARARARQFINSIAPPRVVLEREPVLEHKAEAASASHDHADFSTSQVAYSRLR